MAWSIGANDVKVEFLCNSNQSNSIVLRSWSAMEEECWSALEIAVFGKAHRSTV